MVEYPDHESRIRRRFTPFPAYSPYCSDSVHVYVTERKTKEIIGRGKGPALELAHTVAEIVKDPVHVFKGLRDDGEDEGLCYCGIARHAYDLRTGRQCEPWTDEVFLVFIDAEWVAYNWYWDDCDPDHPYKPINHGTRFGRPLK